MNINRHNYEEFFLLYIDGELNASDEKLVETFLQANPDLQEEFNMLLDTKLVAEDVVFDKATLYKNEFTAINSNNYEEKFLLYVDQELDAESKINVETFVLQNPSLQAEFTALKNTILPIETIGYPDKESLYKKAEKPVIFMWAKRLSVAAAFLLFAIMVWVLNTNDTTTVNSENSVASNNEPSKKNIVTPVTSNGLKPLNNQSTEVASTNNKMPIAQPNNQTSINRFVQNNNTAQEKNVVETVFTNNKEELVNNSTGTTTQKTNETAGVINTTIQTENPMNVVVKNRDIEKSSVNSIHKQAVLNTTPNVVYKTLEEDDELNTSNNAVYVGNMQLNKNKVDGLLKKAKGLFAKNKKTTDDGTYIATSNTL